MRAAAQEFRRGGYQMAITVGGPVAGSGGYVSDADTSASVGAHNLRAAGVPGDSVQMAPARIINQDRTYSSATALRDWFRSRSMNVRKLNILTQGPHARRTRLLFQKALGSEVAVGIISVSSPDYNPDRWWRYSEGVRDILEEGLAYLYARLFFQPAEPEITPSQVPLP